MIRVLHICDHLGWRGSRMHGAKRILEILLPRMDAEIFETQLVSLRRQDSSEARLEDRGIPITYLGRSKFDPRTLLDLVRIIREQRIDILHMHGYGASTFGRLAARRTHVPTIVHEHANLANPPLYQMLPDKLLAGGTSYCIAVSDSTREFCIRWRKFAPAQVGVHYFGVDLEEYPPIARGERAAARLALELPPEAPIIGTVTRLHPQKGNRYLVEAARHILAALPDAVLVIAGEGPLRGELEAQARALGVAERVRFVGFVESSRQVYVAADVVAFSSLWEGTPLTLFEAMAVGCPIVTTAVDGNAEVLRDRHDARLVPAADAPALAAAVVELLRDRAQARALAAEVSRSVARYDVMHFVRELETIYARVLGRPELLAGRPAAAAARPGAERPAAARQVS